MCTKLPTFCEQVCAKHIEEEENTNPQTFKTHCVKCTNFIYNNAHRFHDVASHADLGRILHRKTARNAALQVGVLVTDIEPEIHSKVSGSTSEHRLRDAQLDQRLVDKIGLVWAVRTSTTVQIAASLIRRVDRVSTVMARAVLGTFTLSAVDVGEIVIELVIGDRVFILGLLACHKLVGLGDFDRDTAAFANIADGLDVFGAGRHVYCRAGILFTCISIRARLKEQDHVRLGPRSRSRCRSRTCWLRAIGRDFDAAGSLQTATDPRG
jgi:hypothetical protein